jgi:hypothetical protein
MWPGSQRRGNAHEAGADATLRAQLRAIARFALLVMVPLVFYFTTEGTWDLTKQRNDGGWSGGFFKAQAESMLVHARLDVDQLDLLSECLRRGNRCYGYFGLTPSLVRMPFLGIQRYFHSALTPLFLGVAVLLAYWAALQLLQRSLRHVAAAGQPRFAVLGYAIVGALALGPGSSLMFLTRPAVYEEALAWGIAFFLIAVNQVWRWLAREVRSLVPTVLFAIGAANARPTLAAACGVLGLAVAALAYLREPGRRLPVAALAICVLPGLTAAGVLYLKVRSPFPDHHMSEMMTKAPHWRIILNRNGDRTAGLMFAPTELFAYLRPDALTRTTTWPFFDFREWQEMMVYLPPLPEGGAYVERFSSLTVTMPLACLIDLAVAVWLAAAARRMWRLWRARDGVAVPPFTRDEWLLAAGSFVGAASIVLFTVTTVGITNRYLADFYPLSAVAFALGAYLIVPLCTRRPAAGALMGIGAVLLTGWSIAVTLALTWRLLFD